VISILPSIDALLNLTSIVLLALGYAAIKRGDRQRHRRLMLSALASSTLFLCFYLIYHAQVGSVPYPRFDWTRPLYFVLLVPHIVLAGVMVPGILTLVWLAFKERFDSHRRLARWVWPVWMFVSVSGVLIYLMLYWL
jgi:uncharacterized membrane protein YozB (DUF420 family)